MATLAQMLMARSTDTSLYYHSSCRELKKIAPAGADRTIQIKRGNCWGGFFGFGASAFYGKGEEKVPWGHCIPAAIPNTSDP